MCFKSNLRDWVQNTVEQESNIDMFAKRGHITSEDYRGCRDAPRIIGLHKEIGKEVLILN